MSKKIFSITEAFACQPLTIKLGQLFDKRSPEAVVHNFCISDVSINKQSFEVVAGYDPRGNVLFEYPRASVSIHYVTY